jgi:hypothetical protein
MLAKTKATNAMFHGSFATREATLEDVAAAALEDFRPVEPVVVDLPVVVRFEDLVGEESEDGNPEMPANMIEPRPSLGFRGRVELPTISSNVEPEPVEPEPAMETDEGKLVEGRIVEGGMVEVPMVVPGMVVPEI